MKSTLILFFSISLVSCSAYIEKPLESFQIDETALQDGELVEILYDPGTPDFNNDLKYYIKAIVVSKKTNDTVNILTTSVGGLPSDGLFRNFIAKNNSFYNIVQHALIAHQKGENLNELNENDLIPIEIKTVLINKKHLNIETNKYPVIIGSLGKITDL